MASQAEQLAVQNKALRAKIQQFDQQRMNSSGLKGEIEKFVRESGNNINQMTQKVSEESKAQNEKLHELTVQYEKNLKKQIELLTINKDLSEKKEVQDATFNEAVEILTKQYEGKIKQFEDKVKQNVKRIQEMSGSNVIKRLLKNQTFKQKVQAEGVNIEVLEKQSKLEDISLEVQEVQQEINSAETKSESLDQELGKMRELIDTMKELLENMVKEKENVVKQNLILKEKLKQSEELIEKLLGAGRNEYEEDFEPENELEQND